MGFVVGLLFCYIRRSEEGFYRRVGNVYREKTLDSEELSVEWFKIDSES